MPTDAASEHAPASPTSPVIRAVGAHLLITGSGFAPNCTVTVRISSAGHDVVDYLPYLSDADGHLSAALPGTAVDETLHIAVTDSRPDPACDGGVLWSNTVVVTAAGR